VSARVGFSKVEARKTVIGCEIQSARTRRIIRRRLCPSCNLSERASGDRRRRARGPCPPELNRSADEGELLGGMLDMGMISEMQPFV